MTRQQHRKPVSVKPSGIAREKKLPLSIFFQWVQSLYYLFRTFLLAIFLTIIAVTIGIYTYRFYENIPQSFIEAMDMVFRSPLPNQNTIWVTAISGLAFAMIFYGEYTRSQLKNVKSRVNGISKFIAGIVIIILVDIKVFRIDFYRLITQTRISPSLVKTAFGQVATLVLIIFLFPLFRSLVRLIPMSYKVTGLKDRTQKIINSLCYLLISATIIFVVTGLLSETPIENTPFNVGVVRVYPLHFGILLASIGTVAFFYRPPRSLGIKSKLSFGKLLLSVGCFLGIGLLYNQTQNLEIYITYIALSGLLTLSSWTMLALLC